MKYCDAGNEDVWYLICTLSEYRNVFGGWVAQLVRAKDRRN